MAQTMASIANKPSWVDLSSDDAGSSREFYGKLFGWNVEVNPDPQYGGYALARIGGQDAAGIGPKMDPNGPTTWALYIGTEDVDALAKKVTSAGGTVIMEPFDVGDQGRMAVFQDPAGAFISGWQGTRMGGFQTNSPNSFAWAELNARGVEKALPFYTKIFGWTVKKSQMGDGQPDYNEFQIDGNSVAGAWEMNPMVPAEVPSFWQIYFGVDDVDAAHKKAVGLGARELNAPQAYPGGKFSILSDPQGAGFGLMKMDRS